MEKRRRREEGLRRKVSSYSISVGGFEVKARWQERLFL